MGRAEADPDLLDSHRAVVVHVDVKARGTEEGLRQRAVDMPVVLMVRSHRVTLEGSDSAPI